MPPQQTLQLIIFALSLEERNVGEGVIGDPEPVAERVGDHNINSVVTPGQQQEYHPAHTCQQRQPVQRVEPLRSIYN